MRVQLDDKFGSPSTVDVETFARAFNAELDAALGDFAAELEREVSSPVCTGIVWSFESANRASALSGGTDQWVGDNGVEGVDATLVK